jgi:hypothetical protein
LHVSRLIYTPSLFLDNFWKLTPRFYLSKNIFSAPARVQM